MQQLGGGGHYDMAGACLTHTSLEGACMQLKTVLDDYLDHEYDGNRSVGRSAARGTGRNTERTKS